MATIMRAVCKVTRNLRNSGSLLQKEYRGNKVLGNVTTRHVRTEVRSGQLRDILSKYRRVLCVTSGSVIGFAVAYSWVSKHKDVFAAEVQLEGKSSMSGKTEKPEHRLSRVVSKITAQKIVIFRLVNRLFVGKSGWGLLAGNDLELFSQSLLKFGLILIEKSVSV